MSKRELSRDDVIGLLDQFCLELKAVNFSGIISLVGGAAIALVYNHNRQFTTDIDALLPAHPEMSRIISKIAVENGLEFDWINSAVEEFIPFGLTDAWIFYEEIHGITVRIASAPFLLALKLTAGRPRKDYKDIETLIDHLEIEDLSTCMSLVQKYQINRPVHNDTVDFVRKVLQRNQEERDEDIAAFDEAAMQTSKNSSLQELLDELGLTKEDAARIALQNPDLSLIFKLETLKSLRESPNGEYKFGAYPKDDER